jgi:SAM-dependent methyltransferase
MKTKNQQYFEYLQSRSFTGGIYRKYFLYPRLNRYLKGQMLDVGCGIGDMLAFRPNSIGVDINQLDVEFCKQRGCEAYEMPVDKLPFEDGSFDSVLLDNVLEHLADPDPLLTEIKRVMRKDAVLLIGVPGVKGQSADPDHKVFYNEVSLNTLAVRLGFNVNVMLHSPLWKSDFLSKAVRQYCVYSQWSLKS